MAKQDRIFFGGGGHRGVKVKDVFRICVKLLTYLYIMCVYAYVKHD